MRLLLGRAGKHEASGGRPEAKASGDVDAAREPDESAWESGPER